MTHPNAKLAAVAVLTLAAVPAVAAWTPAGQQPVGEEPTSRVAVVGASLSEGFQMSWTLSDVVAASLARQPESLTQHSDAWFFMTPDDKGGDLLDRALGENPRLVLAIDFLFWFGYGHQSRRGAPIESEDERLELLELGFELLDDVECPLVIGDFPDMAHVAGGILRPEQIPASETIVKLNARLSEWAKERENLLVVPLAGFVAKLQAGEAFHFEGLDFPADAGQRLLQRDELHPTLEGLVMLMQVVVQRMQQRGWCKPGTFSSDTAAILAQLKKAAARPAASGD